MRKNLQKLFIALFCVSAYTSTNAQCITDAFYLGNDTRESFIGSDSLTKDGQSFRAGLAGKLEHVALDISATNDTCTLTSMDIRIDITDGDSLNGALLATEVFNIPIAFARHLDTFNFANPAIITATQLYTIAVTLVPGQDCGNGEPELIWYYEFPTNYWTTTGGTQYFNGAVASLGNTQYFSTCVDTSCIIDVSITNNSPTLTANNTSATYQWLDCNNNFSVITGETNQDYTATANGSYAVEVSDSSCTDTSACEDITGISIVENDFGTSLNLYPNPTESNVILDFGKQYKNVNVIVSDITGKQISNFNLGTVSQATFEIDATKGLYFVDITTAEGKTARLKVIKI